MTYTDLKYLRDITSDSTDNVGIDAKINGKISFVPLSLGNTDYAEIMRQVEAGELTIQEADSK